MKTLVFVHASWMGKPDTHNIPGGSPFVTWLQNQIALRIYIILYLLTSHGQKIPGAGFNKFCWVQDLLGVLH